LNSFFPNNIYQNDISYVNPYSINQFFYEKDNLKYFTNYLFLRLEEEYNKDTNGVFKFNYLSDISNDNASVINIEYNFFIKVLSEWVSHYSMNTNVIHEYKQYHSFDTKDENGNDIATRKYRTFKIDFNVSEKVMFDYAFNGWLTSNKFHKRTRNTFFITFLSNTIYSKFVWINMKMKASYREVLYHYLLQDMKQDETYFEFISINILRATFKEYIGEKRWKKVLSMAKKHDKITSQYRHVNKKIEDLAIAGYQTEFYQPFDINMIEKSRDLGDGKWYFFEAENDSDFN